MTANPTLLSMPLAQNGQKNVIPATQATAGDGLFSQSTGFPAETSLPLGAGGVAPSREDFYASTKFYKEKRDGDGHSLAHIWEHRVTSKWANISSVFSHFLFLSCSSIVHFSLLSSLPFSPGFQRRNF